ncbi:hypothetical protein AZH53_03120 [Methanomicrobiaceae archaeon CYW5]|nr:hypothetical protein [Methanovulcanius yangii]
MFGDMGDTRMKPSFPDQIFKKSPLGKWSGKGDIWALEELGTNGLLPTEHLFCLRRKIRV